MGIKRTDSGNQTFVARNMVAMACKAAVVQAIDSVFSDVSDMDALAENVKISKSLGFDGMGCIHPRQINVIHKYFAPGVEEIEKANTAGLPLITIQGLKAKAEAICEIPERVELEDEIVGVENGLMEPL